MACCTGGTKCPAAARAALQCTEPGPGHWLAHVMGADALVDPLPALAPTCHKSLLPGAWPQPLALAIPV